MKEVELKKVDIYTDGRCISNPGGKITRWNEVGGQWNKIVPYQRPENSGSQTIMQNNFVHLRCRNVEWIIEFLDVSIVRKILWNGTFLN